MQKSHEIARNRLIESKIRSKHYYDRNTNPVKFNIGDRVLLLDEARKDGKLSELWRGPFMIKEIVSEVNTKIQVGKSDKIVHNNRLKLFRE